MIGFLKGIRPLMYCNVLPWPRQRITIIWFRKKSRTLMVADLCPVIVTIKYSWKICDQQIIEWIYRLIDGEGFSYGYRKLTVLLKRDYHLIISKKKVYRLCKQEEILRPQRKLKNKHPRKLARNRIITGSNQLWETDIKYGYIHGENRFFYILSVIDVYDRMIVEHFKGLSCTGTDAAATLKRAMIRRELVNSAL